MTSISKILEKVIASRLQAHIKNKDLSNLLLSDYMKHYYSTELALLEVQ